MTIKLYNTATRSKVDFKPLDPKNVRMYVCGPTVYDRAHLGNARPVLVFDVLFRLLRHVYGEDHVTYVRNFTDVDDKINATALARKEAGAEGSLEELVRERSDETIDWYHADMDALGALRPSHEPRATDYIGQMIAMIAQLEADGFAYAKDGHVLFRVRRYADYGKLSGRSVDDMIAGARVEVAPFKEDPMDFVLWKPSDDELPGWDSPWGRGRPGWHIECSAMAAELLGEQFDIHGGGLDLQFPHHENEIAQSKCAGHGFAQVWMHNEMLQVEGKKMSKSLGNFFTVRDLLDEGVPGEVIRVGFLLSHYRDPIDFGTARKLEADLIVKEFARMIGSVGSEELEKLQPTDPFADVIERLHDDLDTVGALRFLRKKSLVKAMGGELDVEAVKRLHASLLLIGLDLKAHRSAILFAANLENATNTIVDKLIDNASHKVAVGKLEEILTPEQKVRTLFQAWQQTYEARNYELSDLLRAFLGIAGFVIEGRGHEAIWKQDDRNEVFGWSALEEAAIVSKHIDRKKLIEMGRLRGLDFERPEDRRPPLLGSVKYPTWETYLDWGIETLNSFGRQS